MSDFTTWPSYYQVGNYGAYCGTISYKYSSETTYVRAYIYWLGEGLCTTESDAASPYNTSEPGTIRGDILVGGTSKKHWSYSISGTRSGNAVYTSYVWFKAGGSDANYYDIARTTSTQKLSFKVTYTIDGKTYTKTTGTIDIDPLPSYTITFKNGSDTYATKTCYHGKTISSWPSDPSKDGYTFNGWYTDSSGGTKKTSSSTFTSKTTLYAQWTEKTATLTYSNTDSLSEATVPDSVTMKYTTATSLTAGTAPSGYNFYGWATSQSNARSGTRAYTGTASYKAKNTEPTAATLYAIWYGVLSYNANGHGTAPSSQNMWRTGTITAASALSATNYKFTGWNTKSDGSGTSYSAGGTIKSSGSYKADTTLYAQWELDSVTITYKSNNGENITQTETAIIGSSKQLTGYTNWTNAGYTRNGWSTSNTGARVYTATQSITVPESDLTLYACWSGIKYTVNFSANGGTGTVPNSITKIYGTTSSSNLPNGNNLSKTGYTFGGWRFGNSSTIYAANTKLSTDLTIPSSTGESVTLSAIWNPNNYIVSFHDGHLDTENAYAGVTVPANKTVTYNSTYDLSDPTVETGEGKWGETHRFQGWYTQREGGTEIKSTNKVTITQDITLYAHWELLGIKSEVTNLRVYRSDNNGNNDMTGQYATLDFTLLPGSTGSGATISQYDVAVSWKLSTATNYTTRTYTNVTNFNFHEVINTDILELKKYDVIIVVNDGIGTITKNQIISSGDLLLDGFKDSEFKIIASRENEGRKVWFRNDSTVSNGQAVFLTATNNQPGDYIFIKTSNSWTLNGTTVNPYSNYGLNYNNGTLALQAGETITVHSPGNYIQAALGGVADNKFYDTPINKAAVKLYGDTYIQNSLHVGNPTNAVTSGYFNGNLEITRTNDSNNDAYVSVEKKNNLGTSISKVTLNSCSNGKHGIFSNTKNQWLIYGDTNGTHIGDGSEYTTSSKLSKIFLGTTSILDIFYPVGSYYETSDANFNPNTAWGGTWVQLTAGKFLMAAGTGYTLGSEGGEATVTLNTDQIPAHTHGSKTLTGNFNIRRWGSTGQGSLVTYTGGIISSSNYDASTNPVAAGSSSDQYQKITIDATHEHDSVGGGAAHNNLPPYVAVNIWHRTA